MTRPRKELVSLADTPYYHIVSRCVRRAFLCGTDSLTQHSYEHRRQWIEDRIRILSSLFAIDICAYAVMSNHYHIVVKLNPTETEQWTNDEVIARWTSLFKGPLLIQRQQQGQALSIAEKETISDIITVWRDRLSDLGWFMKCLNEPIAREANKEDNCTGHFWEGRYKSQALLTEDALLTCMAYVDLNPIRAAMADTPETSDHTSIKERVRERTSPQFNRKNALKNTATLELTPNNFTHAIKPLLHFNGNETHEEQTGIPFSFEEYLLLVDWTGRIVRDDKRGAITHTLSPILERLTIAPQIWLNNSTQFEAQYQQQFQRKRQYKPK